MYASACAYELRMFFDGVHRTDIPTRTDLGKFPRANSPENRKWLYDEQSGHCAGCGDHFEARHLEVDHIIAQKTGGTDAPDNRPTSLWEQQQDQGRARPWTTCERSYN